jgi:DNA helicase-4
MAPVPLPRDLLIAAKARVAHAKLQLEAAHEKMRHVRTRSDWLADRQDLALLDHLIDNLSLRQDTLALAQSEYNWTDDKSLCEIIRVNYPKLVNEVALYRWLHKKLKESMTPDELELLLNESQLDEANKEIITARIESLRKHTKWISFNRIITGGRSSSVSYLGHTPACWNTYIRLVGERLQSMEQERNDLANAALSRQSEIDQLVESRIEIYIVDQTRDQQKAFDDANKAYEDARNQCFSHFQSRLEQDFLAARIEDYAPSDDSSFRQQLEDAKTNFVRDWASRCTRASLDLEQAAAIGSVHGNVLVTARAGSGKTSTLVTRAAFLVKHCCVSPDELLLLVFNRKAAEEMRGRLQKMGCDVPHAMTFHALAYAIVHPEEALIYDSPNDTQPKLSRAFQQVLNEFMDQDRFREDIRKVMLGHFRADWDMLTRAGLTLSREEGLAFRRALAKETLQGGYVKSFGEKVIANFLFEHDIAYKYEKNHWWNGRNYRPDFTIPLGQYGVVIEYFGLAGDPDYDAEADAKRAYWRRKPDWRFIEMMPADLNEGFAHFQYLLRRRLEGCEVACRRLSEEEIWNKVRDRSITRFAQMTRTFVGRCRAAGLSPAALRDRIARHKSLSEVEATFLRMAAAIFSAYLARLSAVGEEDFSPLCAPCHSVPCLDIYGLFW